MNHHNCQIDTSVQSLAQCEYPDILNEPSTPINVVQCYFLLRDNEFHTLHYIITEVLKGKFTAEEIGEAMRIYMLP